MTTLLVGVVTGLALLCAAVVLVGTGRALLAVRVLLDLLTAAGLLRLATGRSWTALAAAAIIIVLRQLVWASLNVAGPWPRRQSPPRCGSNDHHLRLAVEAKREKSGG
ncbi:hypothetical protein [Micromonospora musae]|uniref:hypothetical protein n=1 Tax=Micromonospora musae TaxID=1894970 RepID=UPI0018F3F510|nr:hypothetical protein [Micromonospora musae]